MRVPGDSSKVLIKWYSSSILQTVGTSESSGIVVLFPKWYMKLPSTYSVLSKCDYQIKQFLI